MPGGIPICFPLGTFSHSCLHAWFENFLLMHLILIPFEFGNYGSVEKHWFDAAVFGLSGFDPDTHIHTWITCSIKIIGVQRYGNWWEQNSRTFDGVKCPNHVIKQSMLRWI